MEKFMNPIYERVCVERKYTKYDIKTFIYLLRNNNNKKVPRGKYNDTNRKKYHKW